MDIQALEILSNLAAITTKQGSGDAEVVSGDFSRLLNEINTKVNSMVEFVAKQVKIEREKFYQEHGEPAYRVGSSPARNTTGKDSVEVNKESNSDIYKMFANLDVSSKENFKSSFENALAGFGNYFVSDPIENYNGTSREQMQLDELVKRFQNFLEV